MGAVCDSEGVADAGEAFAKVLADFSQARDKKIHPTL